MRWCMILLLVAMPASAQTLRDKNGNPTGHFVQQGDRTEFRDNNGNLRSYSVQQGNRTVIRDKNGNMIGTETR